MKNRFGFLSLVVLTLIAGASAFAAAPPIRILPVGDSITFGSSVNGGYRLPLWNLLTNAGYNVDFTGTQTGNSTGMADPDHEGHGGWRIDQIDAIMLTVFAATADPDVILLLIGTNDYGQDYDQANATNRLEALIAKMATNRPYCKIIVANLLERSEPNNTEIQTTFNPFVQSICDRQRALGREVYFQNLRSALTVADMPDALHPGAVGYAKMATNWFGVITNHFSPYGSTNLPALSRTAGSPDWSSVQVTFSKPVADSATNLANYSLDGGLAISSATLDAAKRVVTLTTSPQTPNTTYTLTVSGVQDATPAALTIASGSTKSFNSAPLRGVFNNVPESTNFTLVYSLDIPNSATYGTPAYSVINTNIGSFTRVAYYLELQQANGSLQVAWVSMDPFTQNPAQIGVPTVASGAIFQQPLTNMNVYSTVAGVVNGIALTGGNMEFWPSNYSSTNILSIPNASTTLYDWGDQLTAGGYGSMQLHNNAASQTILSFSHWGTSGGTVDIGIGNGPTNPDWTFLNNAGSYVVKTLQVLAQPVSDSAAPTLVGAFASNNFAAVRISFSEPLDVISATNPSHYVLSGGLSVLSASLDDVTRTVVTLITTPQVPMTSYTVQVSDVADRFGNVIAASSPIAFQSSAGFGVFANVPEAADYALVYSLNIPVAPSYSAQISYDTDLRAHAGNFSRIGYYLELQNSLGMVDFVWVSMEAFTANADYLGVPTAGWAALFHQPVTNMNVLCSVPGVTTGTGLSGGYIEFWPWSYSGPNAMAVPNAGAAFDWGDTASTNSGNYGSMQIHNSAASQVLMAFNRWGGTGGNCDIGIGNNTGNTNADYTFMQNGANYTVRRLQVFVLPVDNTNPPVLLRAAGQAGSTNIALTFSEALDDDATNLSHYAVSGGLVISGASLDLATKTIVTLTTTNTPQMATSYTVTVNSLKDRSANQTLIAPNSTASFFTVSPATGGGVYANVPGVVDWTLVADLNIPTSAAYNSSNVLYAADNRAGVTNFTRVAYYLELATAGGPTNFVWVAMDPFTADGNLLGVPALPTGALFQQPVSNLTVYSSVSSISAGQNMTGGNMEFWGWNYQQANAANVPFASGTVFDWGDRVTVGSGGYGSMQIHNSSARQVLMAMNNFGAGGSGNDICLGIGNNTSTADSDWTHVKNAATYVHRRLQVFALPAADTTAPTLLSAVYNLDLRAIVVTFSEPLADSAAILSNFSLGGATLTGVVLSNNLRQIILSTSLLNTSSNYLLTVSGVRDRSVNANLIMPGSTIAVTAPALPPQIPANAPEAADYKLACLLNLPSTAPNWNGNGTVYDVDNRTYLPPFSRVAYYLELATNGGPTNWIFVSMNAFTADPNKIGVPDMVSGAFFQQKVTNMNVYSSVPGIVTGAGIATGNMEFWPFDYAAGNFAAIPNASASNLDWGDQTNVTSFGANGYGSMQIHNHGAYSTGQVLFAFNRWGGGQTAPPGIGIGTQPGTNNMDWTHADNAGSYVHKRLYVLVLPSADTSGPTLVRAVSSSFRTNVVVTFNEILADSAADPANFSISGGVSVMAAELRSNLREIILTTSAQSSGTAYTITVNNVRDRSTNSNLIATDSTVNFTSAPDAPLYGRVPEATNYLLIHHLAIPSAVPNYNINGITYNTDLRGSMVQPFNRMAYYLELATTVGGTTNWIYVSADAITTNINRLGVPVVGTGAGFQQRLTNMNVSSGVAGIVTGSGITSGNIEFWGCNYNGNTTTVVPTGASGSVFDWNDTATAGGHGSMQIHNWGANSTGQVLFAYNKWGGAQTGNGSIGIGTRPASPNMDWTFGDNAATFAVKNFYVLVRPTNVPTAAIVITPPAIILQPTPRTNQIGDSTSFAAMASGTGPFAWQWRVNGTPLNGQTNSWLSLTGLQYADSGNYDVVASNAGGSVTSIVAFLSVNRPPTPVDKTASTGVDRPLVFEAARLLTNNSDPDGDALSLLSVSAASTNGGTVSVVNGILTYTPVNGFFGTDRFTYTVSDGRGASASAYVIVTIAGGEGYNRVSLQAVSGTNVVNFFGIPGLPYLFQRSTNLVDWTTISSNLAQPNGQLQFLDTDPPPTQAFYRTRVP